MHSVALGTSQYGHQQSITIMGYSAGVFGAGCGSILNENANAHLSGVRYVVYVTDLLSHSLIAVVASDCHDDLKPGKILWIVWEAVPMSHGFLHLSGTNISKRQLRHQLPSVHASKISHFSHSTPSRSILAILLQYLRTTWHNHHGPT
jgi:hypothetical protein